VDTVEQVAATTVQADRIVFRYPDPHGVVEGVRLWTDLDLDLGEDPDLTRTGTGWELSVPLPRLDCLEYLFDVAGEGMVTDPGNPQVKDGAFGPHSFLALPGYREPRWLDLPPVPGVHREVARDAAVWQPEAAADSDRLPLLVAHDGPEIDAFGGLTRYVAGMVGAGELPPMRVALLAPGPRDETYGANPAYPAMLARKAVPRLLRRFPSDHRPVLAGQSLGALAALHAAWSEPTAFAGLLLQSGSFFTPVLDGQESGFSRFGEVTDFVATVHAAGRAPAGFPAVAMTCGTAEENLGNNHAMRADLERLGLDVTWGEVRQGHTWTCWRDLLDPHLTQLLQKVWS
jgi:enterochelin esterase-like enzyme